VNSQIGGDHYQYGLFEPFHVIDAWQDNWPKGTAFYIGNALKYIARCGLKDNGANSKEDLLKAAHYLEEAAERTEDSHEVQELMDKAFGIEPDPAVSKYTAKDLQDVRVLTSYQEDEIPQRLRDLWTLVEVAYDENPDAKILLRAVHPSSDLTPADVAVEWEEVRDSMNFTPEEEAAIDQRRDALLSRQAYAESTFVSPGGSKPETVNAADESYNRPPVETETRPRRPRLMCDPNE